LSTVQSHVVSFRLDDHYMAALAAEAEKDGQTAAAFARRILVRHLEDSDRHRLLNSVDDFRATLESLVKEVRESKELAESASNYASDSFEHILEHRLHFRRAVLAILYGAGEVSSEDARKWVGENLNSEVK